MKMNIFLKKYKQSSLCMDSWCKWVNFPFVWAYVCIGWENAFRESDLLLSLCSMHPSSMGQKNDGNFFDLNYFI